MSFCNKDGRLLLALCAKDCLTTFTLSLHLLLHRILDGCRRDNVLKFHTIYLDAPRICGNVKRCAHLRVDRLSGCQRLIQFQVADDITQGSCRQVLNCHNRIGNSIAEHLRVCDLVENDRVNSHSYVILRDNRLRRKVHDLLL